jgi:cytochrome oxidase Cu insertion factor (SCO1/SenC/PrrC family)
MINQVERFINKTNRILDKNIKIQEMLSNLAMKIDSAHDSQDRLIRYLTAGHSNAIKHLTPEELEEFCRENKSTLDIVSTEQEFIVEEIKNLDHTVSAYTMDSFLRQNLLKHLNVINGINAEMNKPLLGKALPAQEYYDDATNTKGN